MYPDNTLIEQWAKEAGAILREGYGKRIRVDLKGPVDLVTEVDHASEALLVQSIHGRFPGHTIITEEAGHLSGSAEECWFIDPLDGTINYAHGLPLFAVSIAFARKGRVVIGGVYDPMRDEMFSAELSGGARLNGQPIHVSGITELISSLLVTGFPNEDWTHDRTNLKYFEIFSRISQGVRRLGSAAYDLCAVSCGRMDGFWESRLKPWDIAAGALIVREAGGVVSDLDGEPRYMEPPYNIIAANPVLHPQIVRALKNGL
jgi:myo-inositol-1(or 4)-monophosphatase